MMIATSVKVLFFTELNKNIQAYGIISLSDNNSAKRLITSKNKIKFNVLSDTEREFLTFQLEDLLTPQKIQTLDSKINNFSILIKPETMERKIIDQVKIEGLQKFEQYSKINPVSIEINDPEILNKLRLYSKKYKFRFWANSLLFSSSIKEDTNVIFITTNGLNDAKDIVINGKTYQAIEEINISEIEYWDKIKDKSHWTKVVLTDSEYPLIAKHFSFAFETTDLHNILNFEYSLLDQKGNLVTFTDTEKKIPALNFTIQII